jgi:hypothetical protein
MSPSDSHRRSVRASVRIATSLLIAFSVTAFLPIFPTVSANSPAWSPSLDPVSWSNGVVLCDFQASTPSVAVSSPQVVDSGLSVGVADLEEVTASGAVVASAALDSFGWTSQNISNDDQFALAYSASGPVHLTGTATTPVGQVAVRVAYLLPAYDGASTGNVSSVAMQVQISQWPWQGESDALLLSISLAPAFPAMEHLVASSASTAAVGSVSNQSGRALEYLAIGSEATATASNGSAAPVGVIPRIAVQPTSGTIGLLFGTNAGQFQSVNYTAHIGIVLPATIAGIPVYDFLLVGALASMIALVIGVGARRIRSGPSDLIYVGEEK